jgi:hypothetical protein
VDVSLNSVSVNFSDSSASETYGDEGGEQFTVRVTPGSTGTPTGTVTMESGPTKLCRIKLVGAAGSCTLAVSTLSPASYSVVGSYSGSTTFEAANSPSQTLVILKATSATVLTLSSGVATYGSEDAESFTAKVNPEYAGTPTGTVEIEAASTKLCKVKLVGGTGKCSPSAGALNVGAHTVVAVYGGASDFDTSTSASATLTIEAASSGPKS